MVEERNLRKNMKVKFQNNKVWGYSTRDKTGRSFLKIVDNKNPEGKVMHYMKKEYILQFFRDIDYYDDLLKNYTNIQLSQRLEILLRTINKKEKNDIFINYDFITFKLN